MCGRRWRALNIFVCLPHPLTFSANLAEMQAPRVFATPHRRMATRGVNNYCWPSQCAIVLGCYVEILIAEIDPHQLILH